jgi:hypothetical protein
VGTLFSATVYFSAASPWPLESPTTAIHDASVAADQVQSREAVTLTVPSPPGAPKVVREAVADT